MKTLLIVLALACGTLSAQTVNSRTARAGFGTLSAVAATSPFAVSQLTPSQHTVQAVVTGAPTGCALQLEGSLDGANWFNLSGSQACTSGSILFHVVQRPVDFVRVNLTALSGGSSPAVAVSYLGVQ